MRVGPAVHLLSNDVSSGLLLYNEEIRGNVEPTAWFCNVSFRWFKLMTSRIKGLALSKENSTEYKQSVDFLREYMFIIRNLKFRPKSQSLMPFQKGILISTQSCLELQEFLLNDCGFKYFLTSRTTQDCVENLFSVVRVRSKKPSALQFKQSLRHISVTNFLTKIETSNYEFDKSDNGFSMLDFLCSKVDKPTACEPQNIDNMLSFSTFKPKAERIPVTVQNHVYYAAGLIIRKVQKFKIFAQCKNCVGLLLCTDGTDKPIYKKLALLKDFKKKNQLVFPSLPVFKYFIMMEKIIRCLKEQNMLHQPKCSDFFISVMQKQRFDPFAMCHDIKLKISRLYFDHRLKISLKQRNRNKETNEKRIY